MLSRVSLSQAHLETEQMTDLYYAGIALTVVNLVNFLLSNARNSYADTSSMLSRLFKISGPKMLALAMPYLVPPGGAQALEL